jgi:hypothetical protein
MCGGILRRHTGCNILPVQATILQSDTLALRVIKDLNLESTPDFQPRLGLRSKCRPEYSGAATLVVGWSCVDEFASDGALLIAVYLAVPVEGVREVLHAAD